MELIYQYLVIFGVFSVVGWLIEIIYHFFTQNKLANRGFLSGPYLPIYGSGTLLFYLTSLTELNPILKIILCGIIATIIELLTGTFFTTFYNIRLWDYTDEFLNIKGHISLKFSIYWTILAGFFYYFMFPYINTTIKSISPVSSTYFLIGIFYGITIMDVINSFSIAQKIKNKLVEFNNNNISKVKINYELFRDNALKHFKKITDMNFFEKQLVFPSDFNSKDFIKMFNDFLEKNKKRLLRNNK